MLLWAGDGPSSWWPNLCKTSTISILLMWWTLWCVVPMNRPWGKGCGRNIYFFVAAGRGYGLAGFFLVQHCAWCDQVLLHVPEPQNNMVLSVQSTPTNLGCMQATVLIGPRIAVCTLCHSACAWFEHTLCCTLQLVPDSAAYSSIVAAAVADQLMT